ncbi:hypothetical protein RCL1_001892 [Eukaryota sp. TZLM3-RCL]
MTNTDKPLENVLVEIETVPGKPVETPNEDSSEDYSSDYFSFAVKKSYISYAGMAIFVLAVVAVVIMYFRSQTGQVLVFEMKFDNDKIMAMDLKRHVQFDEDYPSFAKGNTEWNLHECSSYEFDFGWTTRDLYTRFFVLHWNSAIIGDHAYEKEDVKCTLYHHNEKIHCMSDDGFLLQTCYIDPDAYVICQDWKDHKKIDKDHEHFKLETHRRNFNCEE